jgi:type II secretory pathway component GspD/PulD (secretin)
VSDGRSTNLFVGDTVRYIKTIQSTQNGTTVETAEVQVGVDFNIHARIGGDGQIALSLDQNFSILTGFTPVPGGGNLPQTSDRLTNMFVNMRSGETLALGGLILEQDRKRVNGIPLLKDLPIIGHLFKRTDNSKIKTEIVFFLTAVEVNQESRKNAASPATSSTKVPDPLGDYGRTQPPKGSGKGKDQRTLR